MRPFSCTSWVDCFVLVCLDLLSLPPTFSFAPLGVWCGDQAQQKERREANAQTLERIHDKTAAAGAAAAPAKGKRKRTGNAVNPVCGLWFLVPSLKSF